MQPMDHTSRLSCSIAKPTLNARKLTPSNPKDTETLQDHLSNLRDAETFPNYSYIAKGMPWANFHQHPNIKT